MGDLYAKQATHLTDKAIRTCEIKLKEYIMVDGNGLNIRIRPTGQILGSSGTVTKK